MYCVSKIKFRLKYFWDQPQLANVLASIRSCNRRLIKTQFNLTYIMYGVYIMYVCCYCLQIKLKWVRKVLKITNYCHLSLRYTVRSWNLLWFHFKLHSKIQKKMHIEVEHWVLCGICTHYNFMHLYICEFIHNTKKRTNHWGRAGFIWNQMCAHYFICIPKSSKYL